MCRVLGVSAGGSYDRRRRPPGAGQVRRESLAAEIETIHRQAKGRDGGPRIHAEPVA
jgi:hypothetical protein